MRLMMWKQGGKHVHSKDASGKPNSIDTASDRLIFYDQHGSTVYDASAGTWYRDGQQFTPTFPISFALECGRTVTADMSGKGGHVNWQIR